MDVRVRIHDSVVFLDLEGQMTMDADTDRLLGLCPALTQLGICNIVLNMEQVPRMDCSGIGKLVLVYRQVQENKGHLKLMNLNRQIFSLLDCCRLLTVFEAFNNERDAIASFGKARRKTGTVSTDAAPGPLSQDYPVTGPGASPVTEHTSCPGSEEFRDQNGREVHFARSL